MEKITAARLIVCCPDRNFVTVRIEIAHTELTDTVFPHAYTLENGFMHPGNEPGLGVDIDESLAAIHPYERAYLPVNRLEDGTMFDW